MEYDLEQIEFKNEKRFLSNMYLTKIIFSEDFLKDFEPYKFLKRKGIVADNELYLSSEHLYQALKSESKKWQKLIRDTEKPEKTKNLAQKKLKTLLANNENTFLIREDWHDIKIEVMRICVYLKFLQNEDLLNKLKSAEYKFEERNCWGDRFWGTVYGAGENWLGKILHETKCILEQCSKN